MGRRTLTRPAALTNTHLVRAWVGALIVIATFVLLLTAAAPSPLWATPILVVTFGITATLVEVHLQKEHPLLKGEPFPRRVALILFHSRELKTATKAEQEYQRR